jgi:hypothetical protein
MLITIFFRSRNTRSNIESSSHPRIGSVARVPVRAISLVPVSGDHSSSQERTGSPHGRESRGRNRRFSMLLLSSTDIT